MLMSRLKNKASKTKSDVDIAAKKYVKLESQHIFELKI